eukprot:CAMPEP_0198728378 /NCGR_PEP_ID=MMETSP1475-20131203/8907_1 /TAXON_ID= ORGANISM="Unidentified sp., Strain CCMP1999" /NCGR_SAMPLE_ID=MMETSP1475 /ASSEMBLY_ACC=CAM_ASM_001111 /LENGTH=243 /DNA_ID=CAMNT_0044490725 /DNA_START=547 /DNA_END=1278 /DNA_ORIENTATION=+
MKNSTPTRDYNSAGRPLKVPSRNGVEALPPTVTSSSETLGTETYRRGMMPNRRSLIEHNGQRFLVTDTPTEEEIPAYIEVLKRHNVKHVVRVCESLYDCTKLMDSGFKFHDWFFEDGTMPSEQITNAWLDLVEIVFDPERPDANPQETIAVHCRAGLGRAPVLVCLALIENGMEPIQAIGLMRIKRRGAINRFQVQNLIQYQCRDRSAPVPRAPANGLIASARSRIFGRRRRSSGKLDKIDEL